MERGGPVGNCECALCLGMNNADIGSFLGNPCTPCLPVDGGSNGLGDGRLDGVLSMIVLRLDSGSVFEGGIDIALVWAVLDGDACRDFTALVDMGGSIDGPYTKR